MATFAKANFGFASYAAFRPVYPKRLYDYVLGYHGAQAPKQKCVDLGCGHGLISREMAGHFTKVIATDPSEGMIKQAKVLTPDSEYSNIQFIQSSAESLSFLDDGAVDAVVAGQAAHWFNYDRFFPEMSRIIRKGGTLAFWGYKDPSFPDYSKASKLLQEYTYGDSYMGPYWVRPGRTIVQEKYRSIVPPEEDWEDVQRIEYEPGTNGPGSGKGTMFLQQHTTVARLRGYFRTFSAFHGYHEAHPDRKSREDGGSGDLADELFDEIRKLEPGWTDDHNVVVEWGSGLVLARRK